MKRGNIMSRHNRDEYNQDWSRTKSDRIRERDDWPVARDSNIGGWITTICIAALGVIAVLAMFA